MNFTRSTVLREKLRKILKKMEIQYGFVERVGVKVGIFLCVTIILSTVYAIFFGDISATSSGILQSANDAVNLCITLMGAMCLWCGVMTVANRAGITDFLAKMLSPILSKLFSGIDRNSKAQKAISLNIISNFLGLGNAATPLGIEAMKAIEAEEKASNKASKNMILFVVLNTASIQIVPTTVAAIRQNAGSKAPFEIIPAVLVSSAVSVTVAVVSVFVFDKIFRGRK